MGLKKWRRIALAAILTSAPLGVPAISVLAQSASRPVVSLSASPNPALSDSDNVYISAHSTHDNGCSIEAYSFNFGDGYSTSSTYAYAYHYYHVPSSLSSETFTVRLTVHDSCGQSGSASPLAEVVDRDTPPVANLSITRSSSNRHAIFADASGSIDNAEASPYEFDFFWGDGNETTTYAPTEFASHAYVSSASPATYSVTVDVFDYAGTEGFTSKTVRVPTRAQPTAPSNVHAAAGNTRATVSWSTPASGGTPRSYIVTASPGPATAVVGGRSSQATVMGLRNGTTYSFTVTATNGGGAATSQPSNPVTPIGPPGAPTLVSATEDDAAAVVSWAAPTINGKPLSHHQGINYTVTSSPGGAQTIVSGNPAPTNTTISGLTNGISYTFTVTASNSIFTSPSSAASNSVTPDPKGPTIIEPPHWKLVEPSTVGTSSTNLPLPMTILWSGRPGSAAICSYTLQRSLNNGPWTNVTLSSATTTTASDTIPASLDRVRYQVQATDCSGVVSSWVQSPEFGYQLFEENNSKFTYTADWRRTQCTRCAGGFDEATTTANATATLTLNAAYNLGLVFAVGPTLGSANAFQDGHFVGVVDTYAPTAGYRHLLFKTGWATFGFHIIQVVNLGTAGHPGIHLDGAVVLYAPLARLGQ